MVDRSNRLHRSRKELFGQSMPMQRTRAPSERAVFMASKPGPFLGMDCRCGNSRRAQQQLYGALSGGGVVTVSGRGLPDLRGPGAQAREQVEDDHRGYKRIAGSDFGRLPRVAREVGAIFRSKWPLVG